MLLILMTQHLDGQGGIDPQWRPRQSALAVALTKSLLHSLPPELLLQPLMTIKLLKGYDFLREESFYLFSARDSAAASAEKGRKNLICTTLKRKGGVLL